MLVVVRKWIRREQTMVTLTQSLEHWLWINHREIIHLLMFGHIELFTEDMRKEYLEWCETEEGRSYLKGGSNYKESE